MGKKKFYILGSVIIFLFTSFFIYNYNIMKKEKERIQMENKEIESFKISLSFLNNNNLIKINKIIETDKLELDVEFYDDNEQKFNELLQSKLFTIDKKDNKILFKNNKNELKIVINTHMLERIKMAIIIDDVGNNLRYINDFKEIDKPLTFAIIPFLSKSKESNEKLKELGYETILHMPMEGSLKNLNDRTKGLVYKNMSNELIREKFNEALKNVGEVSGFNNHMGSVFTASNDKMKVILDEAKSKGLFYFDSRTTSKSKGYKLAKEMGIKTNYCMHFLDNDKNIEAIKKEIKKAIEITKKRKKAAFIAHYHPNVAKAIKESINEIEKENIKMVSLDEVLN
ncbi:hypothetical protein EV215_1503 [Hypnocyclicus thermotrophus]|uniref:Divergent polysaccharide deacetylase n=1 Tax=Hypnocyclicus thermotrophus TaxID=1627895 RepID=A0AA46DXY7_9FUSO|nr:divergent polysaccharide deacetylase family protein [Hypnocyclicus thermotrophus]TDT69161.1 hypothetical protein EV215_1503 [Hypnocyclicus thermotrophus]